jgi:hypothetical protein
MEIPKNPDSIGETPHLGDEFASSASSLLDARDTHFALAPKGRSGTELARRLVLNEQDKTTAVASLATDGIMSPVSIAIFQESDQFPYIEDDNEVLSQSDYFSVALIYNTFTIRYATEKDLSGETDGITKEIWSSEENREATLTPEMRKQELDHYFNEQPNATKGDYTRDVPAIGLFDDAPQNEQKAVVAMLKAVLGQ